MDDLEEQLLALPAAASSMDEEIKDTVQWTSEIDGILYVLTSSESVGCTLRRFERHFPRNVICFRGIFLPIYTLCISAIGGKSSTFFILPRCLERVCRLDDDLSCNAVHSSIIFWFNSTLTRIERWAFFSCAASQE
jgi:hypothetical protein